MILFFYGSFPGVKVMELKVVFDGSGLGFLYVWK